MMFHWDVLWSHLEFNSIQSAFQAPLGKQHRTTTTAAIKVVNPILNAVDKEQFYLSLFKDFSRAFDAVDYSVLLDRIKATGFQTTLLGGLSTIFLAEPRAAQTKAPNCTSHQKGSSSRFSPGTTIIYNLY